MFGHRTRASRALSRDSGTSKGVSNDTVADGQKRGGVHPRLSGLYAEAGFERGENNGGQDLRNGRGKCLTGEQRRVGDCTVIAAEWMAGVLGRTGVERVVSPEVVVVSGCRGLGVFRSITVPWWSLAYWTDMSSPMWPQLIKSARWMIPIPTCNNSNR